MTALAEVYVHPSSLEWVRQNIEWLAADELLGCDIPPLVEVFVCGEPGNLLKTPEMRQDAWTGLQEAVQQRDAIYDGTEHWRVRYPNHSWREACDFANEEVDCKRQWLLTGRAGR